MDQSPSPQSDLDIEAVAEEIAFVDSAAFEATIKNFRDKYGFEIDFTIRAETAESLHTRMSELKNTILVRIQPVPKSTSAS